MKISHELFNNGFKDLSTKDFLKHDVVHFYIDKELGIENENPMEHGMEIEAVAGIMHTVYDPAITNDQILEGAKNLFSAQGKDVPPYITDYFIDQIRVSSNQFLEKYKYIKTGESIVLE